MNIIIVMKLFNIFKNVNKNTIY